MAAFYLLLLIGGWWVGQQVLAFDGVAIRPSNEPMVHRLIMTLVIVYIIASALPFVPGAEIGLSLLMLFGGSIAGLVYAGMVGSLLLSFAIGRLVPMPAIASALRWAGFDRAHALVLQARAAGPTHWADLLASRAPRHVLGFLLRHRYLALMLLLNLPGNSLLGGGGGIALVAGMSRLFSAPRYIAAVALAVAPVPLLFASGGWNT